MNIDEFRQNLINQGYKESLSVSYDPNMKNEKHRHDFSASLFIIEGELTLITEDVAITYLPGESCQIEAKVLHSERTGSKGTTFLVGKK